MPFWGIQVKPGRPYTHSNTDGTYRLRITQATLAIGTPTLKSSVLCRVGDKLPVLLCTLIPNTTESLRLSVEFYEAEDVIFSVIGPRPVFLAGYFVGNCQESNVQEEPEPLGEDIEYSNSQEVKDGDESEYDLEDGFIDDEPILSDRDDDDDDDEINISTRKQTVNGGYKRLKKCCQSIDSDTVEEDNTEGKGVQPILSVPSSPDEVVLERRSKKKRRQHSSKGKDD